MSTRSLARPLMPHAGKVSPNGRYLVSHLARRDPIDLLWQGCGAKGETNEGFAIAVPTRAAFFAGDAKAGLLVSRKEVAPLGVFALARRAAQRVDGRCSGEDRAAIEAHARDDVDAARVRHGGSR